MKALWRFYLSAFIACAAALPRDAAAHASDVVLVRLLFGEPSTSHVTLEATADLEGVAWLRAVSNPAEVLGKTLRIHLPNGHSWLASELGKPTVSVHTGFSPPSPVPLTHGANEAAPELYTVSWKWRPSETPLRFEVTENNPATVLLWTVVSGSDAPQPGWQMLLAGERSNPIALPFHPAPLLWNWKARAAAGVALCGLGLQGCLFIIRLRRLRRATVLPQ
jgi:hypothetical protein